MAYILVSGLRRLGLKATALAEAQVSTIRTKLLKIGAQIRVTVRKVWGVDGIELSVAGPVSAGLDESALLTKAATKSLQSQPTIEIKTAATAL